MRWRFGDDPHLIDVTDTLEREGVSFDRFREDIRNEIVISRLREREVDNKITIADSEIDTFLSTRQIQEGKTDEYHLSHILVSVPEQASPERLPRLLRSYREK